LAGGLALSGFPVITSGFWSKDEILAHAWNRFLGEGFVSLPFFVWLLLTLAAFLTAFYTGRQIWLTFFGEPRSDDAEHAQETPLTMTVPLIVLAFFALTLGFAGIPEEIVGEGNNWFHRFIGDQFSPTPLSVPVMLLAALLTMGGLFLSWLIYGRNTLKKGQRDPLVKALGPVHAVLKNQYYVDEFYQATFVRGSLALANLFYQVDYRWVVDPLVNGVGRVGVAMASAGNYLDEHFVDGTIELVVRLGPAISRLYRLFEIHVLNAVVDSVGQVTEMSGEKLRTIQTGCVQNYLMVALITVLVMLGLYLVYLL
jgi:NADH-quinone oxidoreductase subunit L